MQHTLGDIIQAWREDKPKEIVPEAALLHKSILQLLAHGEPVSIERLAASSGLSVDLLSKDFEQARRSGAEFDAEGNLIGMALSLSPSRHHFRVKGASQQLYAWCALDTLFLPGLLGQTAEVASTCPVTGDGIRLTVTPDGIDALDPPDTVLSIFIPGITTDNSAEGATSPQGDVCGQMHFFASQQAAQQWLNDRADIAVLSVADAYKLARAVWVEPFTQALAMD